VGPRVGLDSVERKIPSPRRESNPRTPIVQSVAQRYTELSQLYILNYNLAQELVIDLRLCESAKRKQWALGHSFQVNVSVIDLLRRIFGPKREEVTRSWRRLHSEALHNLYASPIY
jgi:hypothetical protein